MSKITDGNPWTIPPRRAGRIWLVLAAPPLLLLLLLGAYLATRRGATSRRAPTTPSHAVAREIPGFATRPDAAMRNGPLTSPRDSFQIPIKKVETLRVTPAGAIERRPKP